MEYLDVLDGQGQPTGRKKLRRDVQRDGDWHRAVHLWIVTPNGKILLQHRSDNMVLYPGLWDASVTGHVVAGEDPINSAIRETKEELGISLAPDSLEYLFTVKEQADLRQNTIHKREFVDVYLAELDIDPASLKLQEEEVSEVKLVPVKELQELVKRDGREFAPHPDEYPKLFNVLGARYGAK